MKKLLALLLAAILIISLAACSGDAMDEPEDVFDAIEGYLDSDEFEEDSQKWADEIESLLP